jgi:hypothetical protein
MTTIIQKARWPIFGTGLILIAIGGFGLLTNAPWAGQFGSIATIFGMMMSFAQMFIAFPTTAIAFPHPPAAQNAAAPLQPPPAKASDYTPPYRQPAPSSHPDYPAQRQPQAPPPPYSSYPRQERRYNQPGYTPPPPPPPGFAPYTPYGVPAQAQVVPKRYKKSGIALWIGACCSLLLIYASAALTTVPTLDTFNSYYSLIFLQGICYLLALRGIHAKHARTAGLLGVIAIMVIGGALLLSIIASAIFVANYNPGQPITNGTVQLVTTFSNIDDIFIVVGDILLGLSLIHGKVYPSWIGFTGIVLGCVTLIETIMIFGNPTAPVPLALISFGYLLSVVQNVATGWVLFKKPVPVQVF